MKKLAFVLLAIALLCGALSLFAGAEEATPAETPAETETVTEGAPEDAVDGAVEDEPATVEDLRQVLNEFLAQETDGDKVDYIVSKFGYIGILALLVGIFIFSFVRGKLIPRISKPVSELATAIPAYLSAQGEEASKSLSTITAAAGELMGMLKEFSALGISAAQLKALCESLVAALREDSAMLNEFVQRSNASQAVKDEVAEVLKARDAEVSRTLSEGGGLA